MLELFEILQYGFFQRALISGILLGISCALLGIFLILRRMTLIGDGISHIAFAGIVLGMFLNLFAFEVSVIFTILCTLLIVYLKEKFSIKNDVALGIVFTLAMAIGIILLSASKGFSSDVHYFLFGSITSVNETDLTYSFIIFLTVLGFIISNYKNLFYICFDETGAKISGINVTFLNNALLVLTAILVIISIKIIGVLLVSSLLIIPAATAILISDSFKKSLLYSSLLSVFAVITGLFVSYLLDMSSGGIIVLVSGIYFLIFGILKNYLKLL
ncbi:MAG: metal ABC transporter permease [Candidatus Anstonellales archaeon]